MISKKTFDKCLEKGITMAFAESMTGGALTYEMVKYPNASKVVIGSVISYQRKIKEQLLNVDAKVIDEYSIVSKEVSNQMALGIFDQTQAELCISITGNAGPTYEKNTEKLEAFITILYQQKYTNYHLIFKNQQREKNIRDSIDFIYQKVYEII
ncbi:CinA family protein [Mariniplasma anaerobium]|uniref:Competence-damage inducible protein n=1 Tax=Mariniplasma anaerobium TaxID=2735436 RepID=A0A7U9TI58_9MOLU|nr:CinA family protein [Mariniplasma anaerobium]BCR35422.1 competence-damage inducible protein [Mariniplasma anaerobium]